jgi:diketogulonate reductase-like aldo/keto reductase
MAGANSSNQIPSLRLYTGATIPVLGLGTYSSGKYTSEQVAQAVLDAASLGYRHFDCASMYANEKELGQVFSKILETIPREELFITSKLPNDKHGENDVIPQCQQTLRDLQLDYLDLYLIHWPFPHKFPTNGSNNRDPNAHPYSHEEYMQTWRQMEKLVEMGLVKHIGTSNMTKHKMELLLRDCKIKPVVEQFELHVHFQQSDLFYYFKDNNIVPVGYCPVGRPNPLENKQRKDDTVDIEDPVIVSIAKRLGIHPAEVCILWIIKLGGVAIPFSAKREQYERTIDAVKHIDELLTDDDMQQIAQIDKNFRIIKAESLLWEGAKDWHDLWDENL